MKRHIIFFTALTAVLSCIGCKNDITPSLYDPNYTSSRPQPVVDSISPAGSTLAATAPITIYGSNFSTTLAENTVYFNGVPATLVSATATQIVCYTPADSGDMTVKVSVTGSDKYSADYSYRLILAVETYGGFTPPTNGTAALTRDANDNLYYNILASAVDNGISVISTTGTKSTFAPKTSGVITWLSIKLGKDGTIYAVRNNRAVYTFAASGGTSALPWVSGFPATAKLADLDFDAAGLLWVGGDAPGLYSVKSDKTLKLTAFAYPVRSLRVYNGYLYFAALKDTMEQIFRAPINGDVLGTVETVFNLTTVFGSGYAGNSMTFSSDGYLYVATKAPEGIVVIAPDGSYSTIYTGYSDLFGTSCISLVWGEGEKLFASTLEGNLLLFHTQKTGAPYLGVD